ncbi:MAG: TRAP transporter small permease [Gammaproteobacteria bacterium]
MKLHLPTIALNLCYAIMICALLTMLCLVFGNVVLRYVFDSGIAASEELARLCFIWCTFVGAMVALHRDAHVGIAGIRPHLPIRWQRLVDVVALLAMICVSVVMVIGSVGFLMGNLGGRTPILEIPMATAFAALVVCAIGLTIVLASRLWHAARLVLARNP